jgi:hypothetical protein
VLRFLKGLMPDIHGAYIGSRAVVCRD